MFCPISRELEKNLFRSLNRVVKPALRAGFGSSRLSPVGAVLLETTGRKSGRSYQTPLLASQVADLLLVSTVRSGSQWVKNLAAGPHSQVWLRGRPRPVTAYVIEAGRLALEGLPPPSTSARRLIEALQPLSRLTGASFAILQPTKSQPVPS